MTDPRINPVNPAEQLIFGVFKQLENEADPQIVRLRLENQLRRMGGGASARTGLAASDVRPPVRIGINIAAFAVALLLIGGWASNLSLPGWDDGQEISLQLPVDFVPAQYPHWVALMSKHTDWLAQHGGHSLIVNYVRAQDGTYVLELDLLGVDYTTANEWVREMMRNVPELAHKPYAITQPMLSYNVTIKDMLAYKLNATTGVERRVVAAWQMSTSAPGDNGLLYLIAQPSEYARRVSMISE